MKRNGLLGTGVNTLAAFSTGYPGFATSHTFLVQGEHRTGFHAQIALCTLLGIDSNLEYIELIGKGLKGPHRAE